MKIMLITILPLLVSFMASCGSSSSSQENKRGPTVPDPLPANVTWRFDVTSETAPSGTRCVVKLSLTNSGDVDSKPYLSSARVQFSTVLGQIPWSAQQQLHWVETGDISSPVPAKGTITTTIKWNADNNGDYVASIYLDGFGWITHDKDEGGGQWSSQFFPPANG